MRKNIQEAWWAWREGRTYRSRHGSISTRDGTIYSYATPILWHDPQAPGCLRLNLRRYSATTTQQQRGLRALAERAGYAWREG